MAVVMISVPIVLFQNNKPILVELLSALGYLSLIASIVINRGSIEDVVTKPIQAKPLLLLVGFVVAIGVIEHYFHVMNTSSGRVGVIALFAFCWIILIKKAWNKYRVENA